MAKATTAKAPKKVKKAPRAPAKAVALKAKPVGGKKAKKSKADGKGVDILWKLAGNPLVGELLAIGATAAVAAIAGEDFSKGKKHASSKAVKAAGKAAATAIGARLISEFSEVKKASKKASA